MVLFVINVNQPISLIHPGALRKPSDPEVRVDPSTSRLWAASLIGIGSKCQAIDDRSTSSSKGMAIRSRAGLLSNFSTINPALALRAGRLNYLTGSAFSRTSSVVRIFRQDMMSISLALITSVLFPFIHCQADVPVPRTSLEAHLQRSWRTCASD